MYYLKAVISFFLLSLFISCSDNKTAKQATSPPNIIVILVDGPGYSDIGHFGSEISTPNLDLLSERGLILTQFYNAGDFINSSASLLTGLYPQQVLNISYKDSLASAEERSLKDNCFTVAGILKSAGYSTYLSGNWFLGGDTLNNPFGVGFERFDDLTPDATDFSQRNEARLQLPQNYLKDTGIINNPCFADKVVDYLKSVANEPAPFFIYMPLSIIDNYLQLLPKDIAKYSKTYNEGWEQVRENRYRKMMMDGIMGMDENLAPLEAGVKEWGTYSAEEQEQWVKPMMIYAAAIEKMDQGIGKILKALEDSNKSENTMIIFISVNSDCNLKFANFINQAKSDSATQKFADSVVLSDDFVNITNAPFNSCNQLSREGGISSPFIAYWPDGIESASSSSIPVHITDVLPTILDVSGTSLPKIEGEAPPEGISFSPLFSGDEPAEHEFLIWEINGSRAIRIGDYKILSDSRDSEWEIYDILNDRCELEELSEESSQEMKDMKKIFKKESKRLGFTD